MSEGYLVRQNDHAPAYEGIVNFSIPAGQTVSQNWTLPYDRTLSGMNYYCESFNSGDTISLKVYSPTGSMMREYSKDLYVRNEFKFELYSLFIIKDCVFEFIYKNNGLIDSSINFNFDLHEGI